MENKVNEQLKILTKTITDHFNNANEEEKSNGLTWYHRAYNECLLLSQVFELPLNKVVGVLSALSPRNKWKQNLYDTWSFLEAPSLDTKVCTFKGQREKALRILGGTGETQEILKILGGQKTQNFFSNIRFYGESQAVTVDVWAYRSVNLEPSKKNFKLTELAYKQVAQDLDLMPHQVQAVVWGVVRGKTA